VFKLTSKEKAKEKAPPARIAPQAPAGRPKGSKPELLTMLPANFLTSPGIIAGIFAFELVYGLVLAGVMTSMPKRQPEIEYVYEEPVQVALNTASSHTDPLQAKKESDEAARKAEEDAKAKAAEAKAKAAEAEKERKRKEKEERDRKAREKKEKERKAAEDRRKKREAERQMSIEEALAAASKPAAPQANVELKQQANFGPFGPLINPSNDCEGIEEPGGTLAIKVPNKLHTLSVGLNVANSPRALKEASGDFIAEVTIPEPFKPGTKPLIKNLPFVFQSGGLLLWLDEKNYVRVERAGKFWLGPSGGLLPLVIVENCTEGKEGKPVEKILNGHGPVRLRLESRRQKKTGVNEIICSFSTDKDHKTWIKLKQFPLEVEETVQIGISASNVSKNECTVRFEDFKVIVPPTTVAGRAG
jgi:flagellar biosynthesis GTPase FlhF